MFEYIYWSVIMICLRCFLILLALPCGTFNKQTNIVSTNQNIAASAADCCALLLRVLRGGRYACRVCCKLQQENRNSRSPSPWLSTSLALKSITVTVQKCFSPSRQVEQKFVSLDFKHFHRSRHRNCLTFRTQKINLTGSFLREVRNSLQLEIKGNSGKSGLSFYFLSRIGYSMANTEQWLNCFTSKKSF